MHSPAPSQEHQFALKTEVELIGRVTSVDAHLTVLAVDARWGATWDAVVRDFDAMKALVATPAFTRASAYDVAVGAGRGRLFQVGAVGTGYAAIYRVGDRIVVVEPDAEYLNANRDDSDPIDVAPLLQNLLRKSPPQKRRPVGHLLVTSGQMLVGNMWSDYTKCAANLERLRGAASFTVGDEDDGLVFAVPPGRYALHAVEVKPPWRARGPAHERIGMMHFVLER